MGSNQSRAPFLPLNSPVKGSKALINIGNRKLNRSAGKLILPLIAALVMMNPVFAEVYTWTDENGIVHYSDQKPDDQDYTELEFTVTTYESVSYGTVSKPETPPARPTAKPPRKRVVMFSASWCGVCKKARKYFRKKGIRFTEYDIEKSSKGKRLYRDLGATGVPVILVGKRRMNGFSEAGFERIYR